MGGADTQELEGPDLGQEGVALEELEEEVPLLGHADGEAIVLVRQGEQIWAVGADCTHYGGPLAEGLVAEGTIRCPWHHAPFSLQTGHAQGAGLDAIPCYEVSRDGDTITVQGRREVDTPAAPDEVPTSVVILGAGGAGLACAEELRDQRYQGAITLVSDREPWPVDRPNLSKDYLAGDAPEEWLPVRDVEYLEERGIELVLDRAEGLDLQARRVQLASGQELDYEALVLAMGARARRLPIEGADLDHVHTLHELPDSDAILEAAERASSVVIVGASFIGLEAAAALRAHDLEVHVVAPEPVPLARILGEEVGQMIHDVHEALGVQFHLGTRPSSIQDDRVTLEDGAELEADLVILGVGVTPRTELAEDAGIEVDDGVLVDEHLRASAEGVWAAGDLARYLRGGQRERIEHWVVARHQGQSVARDILDRGGPYQAVPFFWSRHGDVSVSYVGHTEQWDSVEIDGDLSEHDATIAYREGGRIEAVATVGRDQVSLRAEHLFEIGDHAGLEALVRGGEA